jgi:hypothetical protein
MISDKFGEVTDTIVDRSIANERSFVDDPQRARKLLRRDIALAVLALTSIIVANGAIDIEPLQGLATAIVGAFVGVGLFVGMQRATAYRRGWLAGRGQMIGSMSEAFHRGMSLDQWVQAELTRDFAVMGIEPKHRLDDDIDGEQ